MKKFLKPLLWSIAGIIVLLLLAAGSGYLWSFRLHQVRTPATDMLLASDAKVGLPVTVSQTLTMPLAEKIKAVEVIPGKGCVASGLPEIIRKRYLWDQKEVMISQMLVPLTPGNIPGGTVKILFSNEKIKPQEWTIPPFDAAPLAVTPGAELQLAGAMDVYRRFDYRYLWVGAALACFAIGFYFWMRSRNHRKSAPVPPWQRALEKLERLRFELRQRRVLPEQGFVRLSDVVRDYIEERFQLPASRKTTSEFLEALSDNNPLPEEQRPFLNDFLSAADQVKFAKAPPDTLLLNQAIDRAEKLISSTGKPEEEKEVKNV